MEPTQGLSEYAQAMKSVRGARSFFGFIVVLCLLVQIAAFGLIKFNIITLGAASAAPATQPAHNESAVKLITGQAATTQPDAASPLETPDKKSATTQPTAKKSTWDFLSKRPMLTNTGPVLKWVLPATKFLGFVSAILLSLTMLLGLKIALVGHRSGIASLVSAFFWSLILLAALTPWQQILPGSFASGALFNLTDMTSWTEGTSMIDRVLYWARLAGYPILALLIAIIALAKFGRGSKAAIGATSTRA